MSRPVLAWWFGPNRPLDGDGGVVTVGTRLRIPTPVELGKRGLQGSRYVLDALRYGSGPVLWRTRHSGTVIDGEEQIISSVRTHLARIDDVAPILHAFVRRCALDVVGLWDAPTVVREYLETGAEDIRGAALDAAQGAVRQQTWHEGLHSNQAKTKWNATWAAVYAAQDAPRNAIRDATEVAETAGMAVAWNVTNHSNKDAVMTRAGRRAQRAALAKYHQWLDEMCLAAIGEEVSQ